MYKKSSSIFVVFILVIIIFVFGQNRAFAADYSDIDNHWAKESIDKWSAKELVQGYGGFFNPDNNISRGEMAVIIDRIMDYKVAAKNSFSDLDNSTWYTDAILKNNLAGVMVGDKDLIRPNDNITRQEAAVMLARALGIDSAIGNTDFEDDADIASWAKGYVKAFRDLGVISGFPGNIFSPKDYITRASVVKIIDNTLDEWITDEAVITADFEGFVVVNTSGVRFKDLTIDGNLIIAEGVDDGEIHLDNVIVEGDVRVHGGGINSIYLKDCIINGELIVSKIDGEIRIVSSGRTEIKVITLASGAILVEQNLLGEGFEQVIIPKEIANKSNIILDGDFDNIEIIADDITIIISENTNVGTLTNNGDATIIDNRKDSYIPRSSKNKVTIIQPESIQISSIDRIRTEDEVLLSATILPENTTNKEIIWSVNDESIASIDQDGKLTGITPGAVEVTATSVVSEVYDLLTVEIVEKTSANGIAGLTVEDNPSDITHTILTTPDTDNSFVYKTKNDDTEFDIPFVGDSIDDYIEITNNTTNIETTNGYYIGVYELDSEGKVLNFEQVQAIVREHSITNGEINYIEDLCIIGRSNQEAIDLGYDQSYPLSGNYKLMSDLDFADSSDYRNPSANMDLLGGWSYDDIDSTTGISSQKSIINTDGFTPLGEYTGTFNGNYQTINNLYINKIDTDYVGLFSKITSANVQNIIWENVDITGNDYVGSIAGLNTDADVISCTISGTILGNNYVGGGVGKVETSNSSLVVNDCTISGNVSGNDYVGGLTGSVNYSSLIINSNSSVDVQGNNYVGGVIGIVYGSSINGWPSIVTCNSSGNISGANNTGGLAGDVTFTYIDFFGSGYITVSNCSASGTVTQIDLLEASSSYNVGGLIGSTSGKVYIKSNVFIGSLISNSDNVKIGGIVGYAKEQTFNADVYRGYTIYSYSTGEISVAGSNVIVGGLIGLNEGSVSYCYATSKIDSTTETGTNKFGGLVGVTNSTIKNSIAFNEGINFISGESGRVAGVINNGGSLINNYAYGWMEGITITDGSNTLDGKNGNNVYTDSFSDADFYNNSTFWNTNPWNANTNIYFTLKNDRLVLYSDSELVNQISDDDGSLFETIPSPVVPTLTNYEMLNYDIVARNLPITLPAPDEGNRYIYKINSDGSLFDIPEIGDVITGFQEIADYTSWTLDIRNGENIGIIEVDSTNTAKKFVQFNAVVEYSMKGSGTEADPYQIAMIEDLYAIYNSQRTSKYASYDKIYSLDKSYKLINDLDFANPDNYYDPENNMSFISGWVYSGNNISTTKTGEGFTPIGDRDNYFSGTFNGNSYTIDHLYINKSLTESVYNIGFFGYIHRATISNLNISNAQIQAYGYCGILVGAANDYPSYTYNNIIENCSIQGSIKGYQQVGGIVGWGNKVNISNCSAEITVEATKSTYGYAGGISGSLGSNSEINDCTVIGTVRGYDVIDEITPYWPDASITNCDISQCSVVIL